MRRFLLIGGLALTAAASAAFAFAATGGTASRRATSYADAARRTLRAPTHRFSVDVKVTKDAQPLTMHVRGASAPDALQIRLKMDDTKRSDGTVVPGMNGAILIDGPFLYERAPDGMVLGKIRWLRLHLADLSPSDPNLRNINGLTSRSLLQVLDQARMRPTGDPGVFSGKLAYDNPVVRNKLGPLTGDIEFRHMRATVLVGTDGRVHRVRITGSTADRSTSFRLMAYLYAFGQPVKVKPPAQDAFLDPKREQLAQ
jgi:hypothetical protein